MEHRRMILCTYTRFIPPHIQPTIYMGLVHDGYTTRDLNPHKTQPNLYTRILRAAYFHYVTASCSQNTQVENKISLLRIECRDDDPFVYYILRFCIILIDVDVVVLI